MRVTIWLAAAVVAAGAVGCSKQKGAEPEAAPPESAVAAPAAHTVVALDDSNFDSTIRSGVVLVDFWASWCAPCRMQGPIVEQVASRIQGKATIAKLDVDAAPRVAQQFNIRGIPTIIVFKDGTPKKQFVGVTQADALLAALHSALEPE